MSARRIGWVFAIGVVAIGVFGIAGSTRADAIYPRHDCPFGTASRTDHAGSRCSAATCDASHPCAEPRACVPRRICAVDGMVPPAGGYAFGSAPFAEEQVVTTCAPTETCTGTEASAFAYVGAASGPPRCDVRSVCVAPSLPSFPPMPAEAPAPETPAASEVRVEGDGCSARPDHRGHFALITAALALVLALGRRR